MTGTKKHLLVELDTIVRQVASISHCWIRNVVALNTAPQRLVKHGSVEGVLSAEVLSRGYLVPIGGIVERHFSRRADSSSRQQEGCRLRQIGVAERQRVNRVVGPGPQRHFK